MPSERLPRFVRFAQKLTLTSRLTLSAACFLGCDSGTDAPTDAASAHDAAGGDAKVADAASDASLPLPGVQPLPADAGTDTLAADASPDTLAADASPDTLAADAQLPFPGVRVMTDASADHFVPMGVQPLPHDAGQEQIPVGGPLVPPEMPA